MEQKVLLAMECARWLNSVRRDIHQNTKMQAEQLVAFPDKAVVIEQQKQANTAEYLKTVVAVEKILDSEMVDTFSKLGIDINEEITLLKQSAQTGVIDYDPPDYSVLRR